MDKKVILVSIDGMRPDGLLQCGNPYVQELMKLASYTLDARTVFPSVTLPCHMSLFHSIPPERHGITTNLYMPQVRPVKGLFEQVKSAKKKAAMFYGWEPLRDVARPGSLFTAGYEWAYAEDNTDRILTGLALDTIEKHHPDFVFVYMVETDEKGGHDNGWMTDAYLKCIHDAIDNVKTLIEQAGDEYTVIVTADHGGHDRAHGTDMPEDMTIPMFFYGPDFEAGKELHGVKLLDLAPTIAKLMNVNASPEWEGTPLI
jgi:predicted AlkP superfamily pyrophosphatase or phosphodiesterase